MSRFNRKQLQNHKALRFYSKISGQKIVKPSWILDSIRDNQLKPWIEYRLINPTELESSSKRLSAIFPSTESSSSSLELNKTPQKRNLVETKQQQQQQQQQGVPNNNIITNPPQQQNNQYDRICTDKNFLANYYNSSRLHHLSEWKKKFQDQLTKDILPQIDCSPSKLGDKNYTTTCYFHVDMDCFFASVTAHYHPEIQGLPIAISHSKNPNGSADIAACNYQARKYGVKNGMWVKYALELCPDLQIMGYEFELYEKVSRILFKILLNYSKKIQILSCDEAFMDVSHYPANEIESVALQIREDVLNHTGCCASIGIGCNLLLARMATKKAKPDGQFLIQSSTVSAHLHELPVGELPGVGRKMNARLQSFQITHIKDLLSVELSWLQKEFGLKSGENLYNYARGIDHRSLNYHSDTSRKSIGVDCNWGVRLNTLHETFDFLKQLSDELSSRLLTSNVVVGSLSLKLRVRQATESIEPAKYLGMGRTDNYSKSKVISPPTSSSLIIHENVIYLCKELIQTHKITISDFRGFGIYGQKLTFLSTSGPNKNNPSNPVATKRKTRTISQSFQRIDKSIINNNNKEAFLPPQKKIQKKQPKKQIKTSEYLPERASQIDESVLQALPEQLKNEIISTLKPVQRKNTLHDHYIMNSKDFVDDSDEIAFFSQFNHTSTVFTSFYGVINSIGSNPSEEEWNFMENEILKMISAKNLEDAKKALVKAQEYPLYFFFFFCI